MQCNISIYCAHCIKFLFHSASSEFLDYAIKVNDAQVTSVKSMRSNTAGCVCGWQGRKLNACIFLKDYRRFIPPKNNFELKCMIYYRLECPYIITLDKAAGGVEADVCRRRMSLRKAVQVFYFP